jgi:hypothetical protein
MMMKLISNQCRVTSYISVPTDRKTFRTHLTPFTVFANAPKSKARKQIKKSKMKDVTRTAWLGFRNKMNRERMCKWSLSVASNSYTEWFKALVQYLRGLLGRSFGEENVNKVFFRLTTVSKWRRPFTLMSLCIIVIVWRGLRVESSWT